MAIEFIEYQLSDPIRMAVLPWIIEDMPQELSGVEVGFLACIDLAATRGLDYLKHQVAHWERCDAEREPQK